MRPVCEPTRGIPDCSLVIMFGFHQLYETQSSSHPGPEMEKGRSRGKTKSPLFGGGVNINLAHVVVSIMSVSGFVARERAVFSDLDA